MDYSKRVLEQLEKIKSGPPLLESSLSRLEGKMRKRPIAIISAFRGWLSKQQLEGEQDFRSSKEIREAGDRVFLTRKDNLARTNQLRGLLKRKKLDITEVIGSYIEQGENDDSRRKKEISFFIAPLEGGEDDLKTEKIAFQIGFKMFQESILSKPFQSSVFLVGTTNVNLQEENPDAPKLGERVEIGSSGKFGKAAEFMTQIGGRPFIFESVMENIHLEHISFFSRGGYYVSKKDWRENSKKITDEHVKRVFGNVDPEE